MTGRTPELLIVVDTEEEFDWSAPFSRAATATRSIPAQARAHEIYDRLGIVPTYVVDYPVATDAEAAAFLRGLKDAGQGGDRRPSPSLGDAAASRGGQPPQFLSVQPAARARARQDRGADRRDRGGVRRAADGLQGRPPRLRAEHRDGRSPSSATGSIAASFPTPICPPTAGRTFVGVPAEPYWLDEARGLLEVPLTIGFFGAAAAARPEARPTVHSPRGAARLRLPGLLARSGLVPRSRLTPEGVPAERAVPADRGAGAARPAHLQPGLSQPEPCPGPHALCPRRSGARRLPGHARDRCCSSSATASAAASRR